LIVLVAHEKPCSRILGKAKSLPAESSKNHRLSAFFEQGNDAEKASISAFFVGISA
jgi:hypothetical protein